MVIQRAGETVLLHQDHHVVATAAFNYIVSTVMARHIEGELGRWPQPRWITFVDVCGSRIKIRASLIQGIEQSSVVTRELGRLWRKQREAEVPPDYE